MTKLSTPSAAIIATVTINQEVAMTVVRSLKILVVLPMSWLRSRRLCCLMNPITTVTAGTIALGIEMTNIATPSAAMNATTLISQAMARRHTAMASDGNQAMTSKYTDAIEMDSKTESLRNVDKERNVNDKIHRSLSSQETNGIMNQTPKQPH